MRTDIPYLPETVQTYRILIVDDNEASHDEFRKILENESLHNDVIAEDNKRFGNSAVAPLRPYSALD